MHLVPSCPVCGETPIATRLYCRTCDITLEGHFTLGRFEGLTDEQLAFIETFVKCEGKLNRMEVEMGLSYPTLRSRLHDIIRGLGYEVGRESQTAEANEETRRKVLEDLDAGKISAEAAMKLLNAL